MNNPGLLTSQTTAVRLPLHPGLAATTRLRLITSSTAAAPAADWMLLFSFGALAAFASTCLDLGIHRIPGHAILRVVLPITMGVAIVPRRGAGLVIGGSALLTAMVLRAGGLQSEGLGLGALTSLVATGPLLDFALRRANGGWKQYAAFAAAGLSSNLLAFVTRGTAKAVGWELAGRRPLGDWLAQASITYLVCGAAAGIISGLLLFCARSKTERQSAENPP